MSRLPVCLPTFALLGLLSTASADEVAQRGVPVRLPTKAATVTVIHALPAEDRGEEITGNPKFSTETASATEGVVEIRISADPVWIIEGERPTETSLSVEASPFGFHPAHAPGYGFDFAREIGVRWHRPGFYFMWVLGQPDLSSNDYVWEAFDRDVKSLPPGMRQMRNLCVCHDAMIEVPGRPPIETVGRPKIDVSRHVEGTTYRPKDVAKYQRWVRAVVERYDGDGVDDMPGLRAGIKHWQVDNEPPRRREGYADLVRITSEAVKQADPTSRILIGGLEIPFNDYRGRIYEQEQLPLLQELLGEAVDIVDLHWFGLVDDAGTLPEAVQRVRRDLERCGFENTPIWFTEMGTYSGAPRNPRGRPLPPQSERQQASEMVKRHVVALGEGIIKVFWAWGMVEGFIDVRDNEFFDNTGFVYDGIGPTDPGRGTRKIVFWMYQKMTALLQDWDGERPARLPLGGNAVGYRFRTGGNSDGSVLVVWQDKVR